MAMIEAPPVLSGTPDMLRSALEQLRLEGAIFFRSEFTDAFEIDSSPLAMADTLHPGAERLILFHIVARGSCWVTVAGGERHWAHAGDVIVLPYGDRYALGGEAPAECVSIETLIDPPPWDAMPFVHHGGGGAPTNLVCGFLYSDDPLFDPAMRALPPVFVVRPPDGAAAGWVQASIEYSLEHAAPSDASGNPIATRLPELVLIEVLREHLSTAPAAESGWIAALRDPVLAPALSLPARGAGARLDGRAARHRGGRVPIAARRAIPPGARSGADPVPDRMAHASRGRAPRHDRPRGRQDRPTRRVRVGGGLQSGLQAIARCLSEPMARRAGGLSPRRANDAAAAPGPR